MATPGAPTDFNDDDIDKGWDDLEPSATPHPGPTAETASPVASHSTPTPEIAGAPKAIGPSNPRPPKQVSKSKEERAAKVARKTAKQEARRAERRATRIQNQKRAAPRAASTAAPSTSNSTVVAPRGGAERSTKGRTVVATRTPSVFSHRRPILVAAVVACLLVLGGLVWFLGWRNGGTAALQ